MPLEEDGRLPGSRRRALLAPERRRRITAWVEHHGAANVAQLAEALGVGPNTIRRDLDALAREGKLIRSHGGAVSCEKPLTRLPYVVARHAHAEEKRWIGHAALSLLPDEGSIFIADGTTVQAFALQIPRNAHFHVVTNSVQIAAHLVLETSVTVEVLGGMVRPELLATDCTLAGEALDTLYWDIAFVGAAALDVTYGITERDATEAKRQRRFMERASRVVALCDSSKLGKCSYARVGPLSLLDILVTDFKAPKDLLRKFHEAGVEVVVAEAIAPTCS